MTGDVLVDTNAIIAFVSGDPLIARRVSSAESIQLSFVVLGELSFGVERSTRRIENQLRIERIRQACVFLPCDAETAIEYGRVKNRLRAAGRPIPEGDIWLAAQSFRHGVPVLSRDRHFSFVEGLRWETC
ncbi:MAG: type II toxin-antitoxin system VapC family toxin [Planctomycetota bacterium]